MSSSNKKALTVLGIVTAAIFAAAVISKVTGLGFFQNAVMTVVSPVQKGVHALAVKAGDAAAFFGEMKGYREENRRLVEENIELKRQIKTVEEYQLENNSLKELLRISNSMDAYSTVAANVISYMPHNWYDTIEIDRGTMHGVQVGNAVISSAGVVGRVSEAGLNWAVISSILNTDTALGARVTRTGDIGVIEGDDTIAEKNICKISFLENGSGLIEGDMLETSGSGGIYPPGISIGKVKEINADSMGTLKYAIVEPGVKFESLRNVIVITGVK